MIRIAFFMIMVAILVLMAPAGVLAGVRQMNSVNNYNNTNVGTNPYGNTGGTYGMVNPNYNGQATVYRGENGAVAVGPQGAVVVGDNGATAMYNGSNAIVTEDSYYDSNNFASTVQSGLTVPYGAVLQYAPSGASPVMVSGTRYYYVSNIFLEEVFDGTQVVYQVVPAPVGAVVTQLPAGCTIQTFNGTSISMCAGTSYQQVAGGYQVVSSN